jgi:hypothetical protein
VGQHRYCITISGSLGETFLSAFDGFKVESLDGHTALIADMDQAALHGVLDRIQSLGLELEGLTRRAGNRG